MKRTSVFLMLVAAAAIVTMTACSSHPTPPQDVQPAATLKMVALEAHCDIVVTTPTGTTISFFYDGYQLFAESENANVDMLRGGQIDGKWIFWILEGGGEWFVALQPEYNVDISCPR